jgi:hypothetical protein
VEKSILFAKTLNLCDKFLGRKIGQVVRSP